MLSITYLNMYVVCAGTVACIIYILENAWLLNKAKPNISEGGSMNAENKVHFQQFPMLNHLPTVGLCI